MTPTTSIAGRLITNLAFSRGVIVRKTIKPIPYSSTRARNFCSVVRTSRFEKGKHHSQRPLLQQSVRYCSHRKAMCRKTTDIPGGSVDVTANRDVLPTNVRPLHYDLTLEPDFEKFSYEGTVVIEYVR